MVVRTSTRETRQRVAKTRTQKLAATAPIPRPWEDKEDSLLREAVAVCGPKRWRDIADMMADRRKYRSAPACRERWITLTNHGEAPEKRKWTPAEDASLVALVEKHDFKNWALVASELPGRSAKQCRERWQNQVRPDLNHGPWAPSEDAVVIALQKSVGNKWATIAAKLVGRTDNMVKNRWYSTLKQQVSGSADHVTAEFKDDTFGDAVTAKRKRESKPSRPRPKPKKRKRSSSSGPKKKKKKRAPHPKKQRLAIQEQAVVAPATETPRQIESPDAVDGTVQVTTVVPVVERPVYEVGGEVSLSADLCELPDIWFVRDERCDYWVPEGVLHGAPQLLSDYPTWDLFDEAKLPTRGLNSDCGDDSDHADDDKPCHPTAIDEFSVVEL